MKYLTFTYFHENYFPLIVKYSLYSINSDKLHDLSFGSCYHITRDGKKILNPGRKKMKKLVSLLATFLLVFGFTNVGYAADDKNCDDFSSQEEAQNYYESNNPDEDPSGLDRDNDGQACEGSSYSGSDSSDEEAASSGEASDDEMTSDESSEAAEADSEGAEMADTATSYPVYMLLGLAIAAFGSLLLLKRRIHS